VGIAWSVDRRKLTASAQPSRELSLAHSFYSTPGMLIGIDLGTATSEVAILRNGRPQRLRDIVAAPHGFLPSVVGFAPDGTLAVGTAAEALLIPHPDRAVAEVKRLMGSDARVNLGGDEYTPAEISAILLRHLKQEAERNLGTEVTEAIITVPAYFTNAQRQATRDAGEMAGLRVRRLINEPTAAALAYGIERPGVEEKILVYDLGGGTLDVTVLELSEGILDVLASTGNTRLGGKDFDERTMQFLAGRCQADTGVDLFATPQLQQRLKAAARSAKEALSVADRAPVTLDVIAVDSSGAPISWSYELTRAAFEAQIDDLVTSTAAQMDEALRVKKTTPAEITTVLMIGGSTRIPLVRSFVSAYFGGRPLRTEVDPDEAVCLGAAVLAGIESQQVDASALVVTDVAPHTLGVAVVREGDLFGADDDTNARYFDPLIPKQSTVPRTARKMYQTANDWQRAVKVQVYQGDSDMVSQNEHVGEFVLEGLPPSPAGSPVEIEFSYNLSGELEVTARARQWGLERRVTMKPSRRHLSPEQKASSRARLDRAFTEHVGRSMPEAPQQVPGASSEPGWRTSRHYSRVAALLGAADRALPTLAPEKASEVASLVRAIRGALERDDVQLLERDERTLTDLLFDLA
jgi:molecular chaperone DnaK